MNPLRSIFLQLSRIPPAAMLVVIMGLATVVAFLVSDVLGKKQAEYNSRVAALDAEQSKKATVVYALKDIPEGQVIPSDALEERTMPAGRAPQDALSASSLVAGRTAKFGIASNTIVSQHDLAPIGIAVGFESRLKAGMRAITFAVDTNTGVAGFVQPESRVDIISMVGNGSDTKAAPILSDVEVIAVGQTYQKTQNGTATPTGSITVAVTPDDTQKLIKGICASKLYLALRNDRDHTPIATVDVNSLFGKPQATQKFAALETLPAPAIPNMPMDLAIMNQSQQEASKMVAPQPPKQHEVEIWSASKKDLVTFVN